MWRYAVTDVCYEKTGVLLKVYMKTIECKKCATRDAHREQDKISETEYFEKYLHHERDCTKNHERSSKVALSIVCI